MTASAVATHLSDELRRLKAEAESRPELSATLAAHARFAPYQRIIGLGPAVVPLILRELAAGPGHWFWALTALTGEDPAAETRTFAETTRAWLAWGEERGLL
jgi:hypothetical protein